MANEPERPIEKLLRAAAKKRRDQAGAPLELHPATRRLLQGEVARTFAKPEREPRSFSEVLGQLWPRLAWGVAILAVLAVAVYVLLPVPGKGKPEALLARNEPKPQAAPAIKPPTLPPEGATGAPAPAAKPARRLGAERQPLSEGSTSPQTDSEALKKLTFPAAAQPANRHEAAEAKIAASGGTLAQPPAGTANLAFEQQLRLAGEPAPTASMPPAPPTPPPVATMPAPPPVVAANESEKLTSEKAGQPAFAYASPGAVAWAKRSDASPAVTDSLFRSTGEARNSATSLAVPQRFAQVVPGPKLKAALADKAAPAHPVLALFQVEQAGRELRIVDGDGSVYSGYVQLAEVARRRRSARTEAPAVAQAPRAVKGVLEEIPAPSLDADLPAPQTYFFRVAGTNRSLHKKVVFTGSLIAATNLPPIQSATNHLNFENDRDGGQAGSAQPALLPLLNARISGKVVVGNGKAVEINALPTSP